MAVDSFSTLTEFAVAIAGFSGIAIAIGARGASIEPLVWFRSLSLLTWALGAAFGSVLPPLAANLGAVGPSIWVWSSSLLAGVCLALVAVPLIAVRRLSPGDRQNLARYVWTLVLVGNPIVAIWQVVNAAGLLASPSAGPPFAGVVWLLIFSALLFVRMLARPPQAEAAS